MADSHVLSLRRLAFAGMFAGLAWGAGLVSIFPNVELVTLLLFVGGWVVGARWGAVAAVIGEGLHTLFSPYGSALAFHPLLGLSQLVGMAASGVVGGWLGGRGLRPGRVRWVLLVGTGAGLALWFDIVTNAATAVLFGQWKVTLLGAVPFTLVHVGSNAALFGTVGAALVTALEPARKSLVRPRALALALLAVAGFLAVAACPDPACALAAPPAADSTAAPARAPLVTLPDTASTHARPDSVGYRDVSRSLPAPAWGMGPAELLRRDDASVSELFTREGGAVERWADERGSAEPLGRFGVAGPRAVLVDWLGLPLTGIGAAGGELTRVALADVGAFDAPRLPVSADEAYRGELGQAVLQPPSAIAHHPRVIGWAGTGGPAYSHSGFSTEAKARALDGFLAISGGTAGAFEPLGPEGDHALATRLAWRKRDTEVSGAYRSSRLAVEDSLGRAETRVGEGGAVTVAAHAMGLAWTARGERTVERTHDASDLLGGTRWAGAETRGSLAATRALGGAEVTARVTAARQTFGATGTLAFATRKENLAWGSLAATTGAGGRTHARVVVGAGTYAHGGLDLAPSLLVTRDLAPGRTAWVGAARGLSAAPDPRATDSGGDPLVGDPGAVRSSTWLGGAGVSFASTPATWRGPWARGAHRLRAAVYAGRTSPGRDPERDLFAGEVFENAPLQVTGAATRFVALVGAGAWAIARGLTVDAGGHALGRSVDGAIETGDPEARAHLTLEGRHVFFAGALDARLAAAGEWIGPRLATPAGDLPAATRLGFTAHAIVDEFELRLALVNALGTNRALPLLDPASGLTVPVAQRVFRAEVRWTFWD